MFAHRFSVFCLIVLACVVQWIILARAVAPGLDAARFAETAENIQREGMVPALRTQAEHPLFPLWVGVVHWVVHGVAGDFPAAWGVSVQLAATLPLLLAILPVYGFSVRLFGRGAAWIGAAFFCFLPEVSRLGADGIADSTHLFFFAVALWAVARYLTGGNNSGVIAPSRVGRAERAPPQARPSAKKMVGLAPLDPPYTLEPGYARGHVAWLVLAGLATGPALLTRAEVLILPAALAAALLALQGRRETRCAWRTLLLGAGGYGAAVALVVLPYLIAMGAVTPHTAVRQILGRPDAVTAVHAAPAVAGSSHVWQLSDGRSMSFAVKDPVSIRKKGFLTAGVMCLSELLRAYWYGIGLLAILGAVFARRSVPMPVDWFLRIFFLLYLLAVFVFTMHEGYLNARYFLPLVAAAIGAAGFGATLVGRWLAARLTLRPRLSAVESCPRQAWAWHPLQTCITAIVVVAFCGTCCWQTFLPLGHAMAAHRAAANWLVDSADTPGSVLDTLGLTGLYSGRATHPYGAGASAWTDPQLAYIVLQAAELTSDSKRSRTLQTLLAMAGQPVATFAGPPSPKVNRDVLIYRWRPEEFQAAVHRQGELTTEALPATIAKRFNGDRVSRVR